MEEYAIGVLGPIVGVEPTDYDDPRSLKELTLAIDQLAELGITREMVGSTRGLPLHLRYLIVYGMLPDSRVSDCNGVIHNTLPSCGVTEVDALIYGQALFNWLSGSSRHHTAMDAYKYKGGLASALVTAFQRIMRDSIAVTAAFQTALGLFL